MKRRRVVSSESEATRESRRLPPAKREPTEAEAWAARRAWVSRNRWYIGGAGLLATAAILWPRTATATTVPTSTPVPTPVPTPPVITAEETARFRAEQQRKLGEAIGLGAFAVLAAGVIYVATSDSKTYRPVGAHVPAYRFIAPTTAPTRSVWSSWVSDW